MRALLAIALVLACWGVISGSTAAEAGAAPKLKTMTYNLHGNLGTQDGTYSGSAIAGVIRTQDADVVGLQEVCASQLSDLRSRLLADGYSYTQHYVTVPGTSCGDFGIAFLSKLPLNDPATTVLPTYNEKRAVISATVTQGGLPVRVFNSHASPGAGTTHTIPIADETLTTSIARRIVMGDFNVNSSNTAALEPFTDRALTEVDPSNTPTSPASSPTSKIDYIWTSQPVTTDSRSVPNTTASDHRPLVATLDLGDDLAPTGGRIAFTSGRDGNNEIYRIRSDGSETTRLTNLATSDSTPEWSEDGTKIVFTSNRDGDNEIYTMNADGTGVTQLTSNTLNDQDPAFSPDGTKIAFRRELTAGGNNEVFTMNANGSSQTNITNNAASDFNPDWSPDGTKIVFQRFLSGTGNDVYSMNANGSSQTALTDTSNSDNDGQPAWSPSGSQIAFHSNRDGDFEIFTMTAAGASETQRTFNTAIDQKPSYSANGTQIAFNSDRDANNEIYRMTVAGAQQTRVTTNSASDVEAAWQPDSLAPETTIISGPAAGSAQGETTATFAFSSSESPAAFECRLDGGAWAACTSPRVLSGLSASSHTFEVRASDESGNVDATPASRTFTVTSSPTVNVSGGQIAYVAGSGQANRLTVSGGSGQPLLFGESGGVSPVAGAGCTQVSAAAVQCPSSGVSAIQVSLGDGADTFDAAGVSALSFTVDGGDGPDALTGSQGGDLLEGGGGDAATDRLEGGPGNDALNGGGGIDRALYSNSGGDLDVTFDNTANDSDGVGGTDNVTDTVESITGGSGSDTITGSCFANTLAGQGGNDTINGDPAGCAVGGGDFMGGGLGDDEMNGLDGSDSVTYTTNTALQAISVTLDGTANDSDGTAGTDDIGADVEFVYGGAANDTIDATAATRGVALWGRAGDDILIGSSFNDFLRGEAGADNLNCDGGANDMFDDDPADTVDPSCETAG